MNTRRAIALIFLAMPTLPVWADTIVGAGETLVVTNAESLGFAPVQMGAGSTLAFAGSAAGAPGLNEYTRTGSGGLGTPGGSSYGAWTRITTNAFWADTNISTGSVEYIYTGRWLIPCKRK